MCWFVVKVAYFTTAAWCAYLLYCLLQIPRITTYVLFG